MGVRGKQGDRDCAMCDIITIGAATRDVFVRAKALEIHPQSHGLGEACFPLGAKLNVEELIFETGGGATNTAVAFKRFGMAASTIARVGHDEGGHAIKEALIREDVETLYLSTNQTERTGYSIILLSHTGERTILVYRGASGSLVASLIPWGVLSKAPWIYVSSLGGNLTLASRIITTAQKGKVRIGWNPGGGELRAGLKKLTPLMKQVEVLILNEEEILQLFPRGTSLKRAVQLLRELPKHSLVVTRAREGAWVATHTHLYQADALGKGKEVNTTGAGDAFASGYIAGLWKWNDVSAALRLGIMNSGNVVMHMGAKNGILKRLPSASALHRINVRSLKI